MYMSRMLEIGKCENGYVVSCSVPLKPKAKGSSKMSDCCVSSSEDKEYIAKDLKEVADLVEDLLPLLDADYTDEKAFDSAFAKATSSGEDEKE